MNIHCNCWRDGGLWQNHIEPLLVVILGVGIGFCNVDGRREMLGKDWAGPEVPCQIIAPTFFIALSVYNSTYRVRYDC